MRQLANWASAGQPAARALVVAAYAIANAAGIWIALLMPRDGRLAAWTVLAASLLAAAALVSYTGSGTPPGFARRKWRSLAFCLSTLLFVAGNTSMQLQPGAQRSGTVTAVHAASLPRSTAGTHRMSIRERLIRVRQWYAEQSAGVKALLIVATVLVTCLLIYFWAAICCGIICDGLEALGYFLFFAGTAGAIFGCVRVIQRIVRGGPRRKKAGS